MKSAHTSGRVCRKYIWSQTFESAHGQSYQHRSAAGPRAVMACSCASAGQALNGRRGDVVLATKVHFPMGEGRNRAAT